MHIGFVRRTFGAWTWVVSADEVRVESHSQMQNPKPRHLPQSHLQLPLVPIGWGATRVRWRKPARYHPLLVAILPPSSTAGLWIAMHHHSVISRLTMDQDAENWNLSRRRRRRRPHSDSWLALRTLRLIWDGKVLCDSLKNSRGRCVGLPFGDHQKGLPPTQQ